MGEEAYAREHPLKMLEIYLEKKFGELIKLLEEILEETKRRIEGEGRWKLIRMRYVPEWRRGDRDMPKCEMKKGCKNRAIGYLHVKDQLDRYMVWFCAEHEPFKGDRMGRPLQPKKRKPRNEK